MQKRYCWQRYYAYITQLLQILLLKSWQVWRMKTIGKQRFTLEIVRNWCANCSFLVDVSYSYSLLETTVGIGMTSFVSCLRQDTCCRIQVVSMPFVAVNISCIASLSRVCCWIQRDTSRPWHEWIVYYKPRSKFTRHLTHINATS